jgi:hypothetical protein
MDDDKTYGTLLKENLLLTARVESLARDLADATRDELVYREEIFKLRQIIEELKAKV